MPRILTYRIAVLLIGLTIAGCGVLPDVQDETLSWTPEKLFESAKQEADNHNYVRAIKLFETLESRYPYGRYAQQAQLEIAYANWKDQEPELALAAAERFIKQHPTHPNVDYAYYLKGLINYNEDSGLLSKIIQQDVSERDPRAAREAFFAFRELTRRFPESRYAEDSRDKMERLVQALARNELHVARYYYQRGAYLAAANRAKFLLENYPQSTEREAALAVMVLSYEHMQLPDLAADAKRVLTSNYPQSALLNESVLFPGKPWWKFW